MDGNKLEVTMGASGPNKLSHIIEQDKFVCVIDPNSHWANNAPDHKPFLHLTPEQDKAIIEYTKQKSNKIVEIYQIDRSPHEIRVVTRYYSTFRPLTVIAENCFFPEDEFYQMAVRHYNLVSDISRAQALYNKVVDEYVDFKKATGLVFNDMNANNIIMSNNMKGFRIVDVASIQPPPELPVEVDPVGILLTGKFRWKYYPATISSVQL